MKVYTGGTFDLFHAGHVRLLRKCREFAGPNGVVVVALNSDKFITEYKGKPPVCSFDERKETLEGCKFVDIVVENIGGSDSRPAIDEVAPNLIVIGSDWASRDYHAQMGFSQDWLDSRDISLAYVPYTRGVSSTEIKSRIQN